MQIPFWYPVFVSFRYIPRSEISQSYGSSIFNSLKKLHIISLSNCTNLHSHQQSTSCPFSQHPCQSLLSLFFLIIAGMRRYLIMVLSWISLMISDAEHLFMCLLSFVCLFWENLYSVPLHILYWIVLFLTIQLYEFLIYFGY